MAINELLSLRTDLPHWHVRKSIPTGYAGTLATVEEMRRCVDQGKRDARIRKLGGSIIRDCREKDYRGYAAAVHDWIRQNIKYAFDPAGIETIEWPAHILDIGVADCDSSAILNAAICESLGLECRFRAIKANANARDEFSHIWSEVFIPGRGWMASDCTMPHGFGWRPPDHYGAENWPASHDEYENHEGDHMAGLGAPSASAMAVIEGIYDGSYRPQLLAWGKDLDRQTAEATAIRDAAFQMKNLADQKVVLDNLAVLRNGIAGARLKFIEARNRYDQIVGELNRIPGVGPIPAIQSGFSGFGALPAAVVSGMVVGGVLLTAAAALAIAAGGISDAIRGNDGIITQTRKLVESSGVAVSTVAGSASKLLLVAAGGFALWMAFKYFRKSGKV